MTAGKRGFQESGPKRSTPISLSPFSETNPSYRFAAASRPRTTPTPNSPTPASRAVYLRRPRTAAPPCSRNSLRPRRTPRRSRSAPRSCLSTTGQSIPPKSPASPAASTPPDWPIPNRIPAPTILQTLGKKLNATLPASSFTASRTSGGRPGASSLVASSHSS